MTLVFYKLVQNFTNLWNGIYKNYVKKGGFPCYSKL